MKTFSRKRLTDSPEYSHWIGDDRVLILHNIYEDGEPTFIVIHKARANSRYTITRFFMAGLKIQVSVDHEDIAPDDVFDVLLREYSRKLA